jgi:hypothetical protein
MTCLKSFAIAVALAATVSSSVAQSTFRFTSAADIHDYQNVTYEPDAVSGQLVGYGEETSIALDTDPRYALLSPYNGLNPNAQWTLFLSDVDIGQGATLDKLGLVISAVPEPAASSFLSLGVLALGLRHWRSRSRC